MFVLITETVYLFQTLLTSVLSMCASTQRIVTTPTNNTSNTKNESVFSSTESASNRFEMHRITPTPDLTERPDIIAIPYVEKNKYNDLQFFAMKHKLNIAIVGLSTGKIIRRQPTEKTLKTFAKNCSLARHSEGA